MIGVPETFSVVRPFLDQLVAMGWKTVTGNLNHPSATRRKSFGEVLLREDLRYAILRINAAADGNPWMDDRRVDQAVSALAAPGGAGLVESNRAATGLLIRGATVEGLPQWDEGREQRVDFIDWNNPENNTFRVISQFRIDDTSSGSGEYIAPDLVLFVNGIPLVVVECRNPGMVDPLAAAVSQLQRYGQPSVQGPQVPDSGRLFHYAQLLVATSSEKSVFGTVGSRAVDYLEWRDSSPIGVASLSAGPGNERLSSQEVLVAGMLRPDILLDIVRNFTLFRREADRLVKVVPRSHQVRAVGLAVRRLQEGDPREGLEGVDPPGGVIWHAHGSGRSTSLTALIRKIRSSPGLDRFRIFAITNRKRIVDQIVDSAELAGYTVEVCRTRERMRELLAQPEPAVVCFAPGAHCEDDSAPSDEAEAGNGERLGEGPWILNPAGPAVVVVDEPEPLDDGSFQQELLSALPDSPRIGFAGTPFTIGARRRVQATFGPLLHRYTASESASDGCTVPIFYESRTAVGAADGRHDQDEVFEDLFREHTSVELAEIGRRYATSGRVIEAPELIGGKVRSMLRHYVEHVLPNGLKAQVVGGSRRAVVRYHRAFQEARARLVKDLEGLDPSLLELGEEAVAELPRHTRFLVRAHPHLDLLRAIESTPLMCGEPNDPPAWRIWTDPARLRENVAEFQEPLAPVSSEDHRWLGFVFVDSGFLAEFNSPLTGVIYLDGPMEGRRLLQTVSRVNRLCPKKHYGLVVDYCGMLAHPGEALRDLPEEEVAGVIQNLRDQIPRLRNLHSWLVAWFSGLGVEDINDAEACIGVLKDGRVRGEYQVLLRQFLETLDLLLPRSEALRYLDDARTLAFLQARARNLYRDKSPLVGRGFGDKIRRFVDDHLLSLGIDPDAALPSITDFDFEERVEEEISDRSRALQMEFALRSYLKEHAAQDPPYVRGLEGRLDELTGTLDGRWRELAAELRALVREVKSGRHESDTPLDLATEAPFLRILRRELRRQGEASTEQLAALVPITVRLVEHIRQEVRLVDFWRSSQKQDALRKSIVEILNEAGVFSPESAPWVARRIMEEARANPPRVVST